MYVEKLPNKKYRMGEWYIEYRTGKRRRVSVTMEKNTAVSRREAQRILDDKIRRINEASTPQDVTFECAAEQFVAYQQQTRKASTAKRDAYAMRSLCRIFGADTLIESLNAGFIMRRLLESGRSKITMNGDIKELKIMLRWCYRNDLVSNISYLDKIEKFKVEKAPENTKYMERDELQRLLDGLAVPINRLLIEFLALSGLRIGEALALEWPDISKDKISVSKTYDDNNKIVTTTKTDASTRQIHIQPELADVIMCLRQWYMETGVRSSVVFVDLDGKRIQTRAIEKYFAENTTRILGRRLTLHSLRHTHASLLFEAGMSLDAVSLRLGHSDSRITKDIYLHITERKRAEYDAQLDQIDLLG